MFNYFRRTQCACRGAMRIETTCSVSTKRRHVLVVAGFYPCELHSTISKSFLPPTPRPTNVRGPYSNVVLVCERSPNKGVFGSSMGDRMCGGYNISSNGMPHSQSRIVLWEFSITFVIPRSNRLCNSWPYKCFASSLLQDLGHSGYTD
jgi:hypothetical protein